MAPPDPERGMRLALAEARKALAAGEMPYGCVILSGDGRIVAAAHNRVTGTGDPTSHAELDAVRAGVIALGGSLAGCTAYSTVEPCCMCSGAAWTAGIAGFVYGLGMAELKALRPASMDEPVGPLAAVNATVERKLAVASGVLREECWRSGVTPAAEAYCAAPIRVSSTKRSMASSVARPSRPRGAWT